MRKYCHDIFLYNKLHLYILPLKQQGIKPFWPDTLFFVLYFIIFWIFILGDFVVASLKISNKNIIKRNSIKIGRVEPWSEDFISDITINETFLVWKLIIAA